MSDFFHWPDHVIGKRESRSIREQHNATVNRLIAERDALRESLNSLSQFVAARVIVMGGDDRLANDAREALRAIA